MLATVLLLDISTGTGAGPAAVDMRPQGLPLVGDAAVVQIGGPRRSKGLRNLNGRMLTFLPLGLLVSSLSR